MAHEKTGSFSRLLMVAAAVAAVTGCEKNKKTSYEGSGNPDTLTPVAAAPAFDASPDPTGENVFFTAPGGDTDTGAAGLFRVPASGGATAESIASGGMIVLPVSVAVAEDGNTVYLADPASEVSDTSEGRVIAVPADGGGPASMSGAEGKKPRGVCAADGDVWFTGIDTDGVPAVFRMTPAGSAAVVAKGTPLTDPQGLAVTRKGDVVYVLDADSDDGRARVIEVAVEGGAMTTVLASIRAGYPSGIALSNDESAILVSAYDAQGIGDAVIRIERATGEVTTMSAGIETFSEPAGLHRAARAEVYAWADSRANGTGTVFVLSNSN